MLLSLKIIIGVFTCIVLICMVGANSGDNVDARATAGLLYLPAIFFAFLDLIALALYFLAK